MDSVLASRRAFDNEVRLTLEVGRQERRGATLVYLTARTAVLHTWLPMQGSAVKATMVVTVDGVGCLTWSRRRGWL